MARYRKIDVRIWGDVKFRALTPPPPNGRYLWFWLLTNKRTTSVPGLFEAGEAETAEALEWPLEGFRKAFREASDLGLVEADWSARVIWVPNAIVYNSPENPNVVTSWRVPWDEIPECPLKGKAYQRLKGYLEGYSEGFREAFGKACAEPSPKGMANQEQEQEQEQEKSHPSGSGSEPHRAAVAEEKRPDFKPEAWAVFRYWQETLQHPKAKYLPSVKSRLVARLREGFTVNELKSVVDNISRSAFHLGENDRGRRYDGIDTLFGSGDKVNKYLEMETRPEVPRPKTWEEKGNDEVDLAEAAFLAGDTEGLDRHLGLAELYYDGTGVDAKRELARRGVKV